MSKSLRSHLRKSGHKSLQTLALIGSALIASTASAADFECITRQWWQVDGNGALVQATPEANGSAAKPQEKAQRPFYVNRATGRLRGALPGLLPAKPNVTLLSRVSASHPFAAVYAGGEIEGVRLVSSLSIQVNPKTSDFSFILDDSGQLLTGTCK